MIIVKLMGRLGNQMFQFALAKSLGSDGKEVLIDDSMLRYDNDHMELGVFPKVERELKIAPPQMAGRLGDLDKSLFGKIRRRTIGYKKTHIRERGYAYHPELFKLDGVYLDGYWQTERYFINIEETIRMLYTFPEIEDEENSAMAERIQGCDSVSLHIRRGDYLSAKNAPMHGDICTRAYYDRAIGHIREHVGSPQFFIFTDDAQWARAEYGDKKAFTVVDINHGSQSFRDMQLMSLCRHHIVANSSFSWWGAWLDQRRDKIVVAPPKWFNLAETPDIWCDGWTVMERFHG